MSGQIFQGNHLIAETNDAPLGFEQGGIEVTQAQYDQLVEDDNVAEDTNYYITDKNIIMRNNVPYNSIDDAVISTSTTFSSEKIDELLIDGYIDRINQSEYSKIGANAGVTPGYFRLYNKPKKIVVIGNSITSHGPREADGINWTVYDYREMAASHPDTGWVTLIKKYINDELGLTDCRIYKGNGSTWEVATSGSRTISLIEDQKAFEVLTTGPDVSSETTLGELLTEDVDLILLQLSENMAEPTTDELKTSDNTDWANLYDALLQRCPKAKIYQFMGFWPNFNKMQVMAGVARNPVFQPMLITPSIFNQGNYYATINYKAQQGDSIYDADDNVIATVSAAVAGHPNDTGFLAMAMQFLDALFNDRSIANNKDQRAIYSPSIKIGSVVTYSTVFKPQVINEIFNDARSDAAPITFANFDDTYSFLSYFMFPGIYIITVWYPETGPRHGILRITSDRSAYNMYRGSKGYNPSLQELIPVNPTIYYTKLHRRVALAAVGTVYTPWYCNDEECYTDFITISSSTSLSPNAWTTVGNLSHAPTTLYDAHLIRPIGSTLTDSSGYNRVPRVGLAAGNTEIALAGSGNSTDLIPATSVLVVKYK